MRELILKNNVTVLLDDDDYEWCISQPKWSYQTIKLKSGIYCRVANRNGLLHRQLLKLTDPKIKVDHIDHNPLNNQRNNLRICTQQQNILNNRKRSNTSSKYKGVSWYKQTQKWRVQCNVNWKPIFLGYFDTELEAALAYDNFVKTLPNQEFRILNFPETL